MFLGQKLSKLEQLMIPFPRSSESTMESSPTSKIIEKLKTVAGTRQEREILLGI